MLLDFLVYQMLLYTLVEQVALAKASGFAAGTLFSYYANKFWTFNKTTHIVGSVWRFGVLYASTLVLNISVNGIFLHFWGYANQSVMVAFTFATGISAVVNFLGMWSFVFKTKTVLDSK